MLKKYPILQFLLVLVAGVVLCGLPAWGLPKLDWPVIFPHVQMPAEAIWTEPFFYIGSYPVYLYNSFTSVMLANIILILLAVAVGGAARARLKQYEASKGAVDADGKPALTPKGVLNLIEFLVEYFFELVEQIVGVKWARAVFPVIMTIFLFVLTINWLHFLPGVDTVGILHCAKPPFAGYEVVQVGSTGVFRLAAGENYTTLDGDPISTTGAKIWVEDEGLTPEEAEAEQKHLCEEAHEAHVNHEEFEGEIRYTLAPFFRTGSTDLNLTLAIALVAIGSVQVFGIRELGLSYFSKFFNLGALRKGPLGWIELAVSVLELISEFAKTLSFTLRLFGNMFAGTVLLFVMMFLIPVGVPLIFFLLEVAIGAIQAFVFALLTLVLISLGMISHGDHHDEEHH